MADVKLIYFFHTVYKVAFRSLSAHCMHICTVCGCAAHNPTNTLTFFIQLQYDFQIILCVRGLLSMYATAATSLVSYLVCCPPNQYEMDLAEPSKMGVLRINPSYMLVTYTCFESTIVIIMYARMTRF